MTSSKSAAAQLRHPAAFIAAMIAVVALALAIAPAAYADHLPEGVSIDPSPAQGVPEALLVPSAGTSPLSLPVPGSLPDEPDIIPIMPTVSALSVPGLPAIFVDEYTIPGLRLYRMDGVLGNIGGAMDLYCQNCNSPSQILWQIVWSGGEPPAGQSPLFAPSGGEWRNLTQRGAFEIYEPAPGHVHWHYDTAAVYEILVPGQPARRTAKIGFCMYDTYDTSSGPNYYDSSDVFWCSPAQPTASNVRMGISPGIGDYYSAQLTDQWIDITGLDAGPYTLRAEVNPQRFIDESDYTNNVETYARVIPGSTAASASLATSPGGAITVDLEGAVVGPDIPARIGSHCDVFQPGCYIDGTGKTPLNAGDGKAVLGFQIVTVPANGTLSAGPTSTGDTSATILYTPNPGFVGIDTLTYTTTDERGLTSNAATISIAVGAAPANTAVPRVSGSPRVGETLSASSGQWSGDGTITPSFQWQRCNAAGASCSDVAGATASTHVVSGADVGSTLRVRVTATNPVGSAVAASAASALVSSPKAGKKAKAKIARTAIIGSRFADFLNGSSAHELFRGLGGPDLIHGKGGSDLGYGGKGRDTLKLGNGADIAYGGKGRDTLKLGNGADIAYGGRGADLIVAGKGKDRVFAGKGRDLVKTRDGEQDIVNCGNGFDRVIADAKDVIDKSCERVDLPGRAAPA